MFTRSIGFCLLALTFASANGQDAPIYAFTTLAGSARLKGAVDGRGTSARFNFPTGIAVDKTGQVFVADDGNGTIRKIAPDGVVTTIAGVAGKFGTTDGTGAAARFSSIVTFDGTGTFSGIPTAPQPLPAHGKALAIDADGVLFVADVRNGSIRRINGDEVTTLSSSSSGEPFRLGLPLGLCVDSDRNVVVADSTAAMVRRITAEGVMVRVAGITPPRITDPLTGFFSGLPATGADGDTLTARFGFPRAVAADLSGNLYVVDQAYAGAIRRISKEGTVSTVAGSLEGGGAGLRDGAGSEARFNSPVQIARDIDGTFLITEIANRRIRRVTPEGVVTTVATSDSGFADGSGDYAQFLTPIGIAVDPSGNIYVADADAHTIRKGLRIVKPVITAQPQKQTVAFGQSVTLRVDAGSSVTPTYQWSKNGVPVVGATGAVLSLPNATEATAGTYTVTIKNPAGVTISEAAVVEIKAVELPTITAQPVAQSLRSGQSFALSVSPLGSSPLSFQWQRNGVDIPGATDARFTIPAAQAEHAGIYRVVIKNGTGSVFSDEVRVAVNTTRIANLSVRTNLSSLTREITVGFVVSGDDKMLLVRGVGPGLRAFGVDSALLDPQIAIFRGIMPIADNDNWDDELNAGEIAAAALRVGAFALTSRSGDSALFSKFEAGAYSARIAGKGNSGVVLMELYDASATTEARLVNVSTRAHVGLNENVLVAGFAIVGNRPQTVLIRAVGPTLSAFGVTGVLADPKLELRSSGQAAPLASNDDWAGTATLKAAFAAQGAFPLPTDASKDAALLVTLEPGNYSVQVSGVAETVGEALLEIYEVP